MKGTFTTALLPSNNGKPILRRNTHIRPNHSRPNVRTTRLSLPVTSSETFPAARLIYGIYSNSRERRSPRWKSFGDPSPPTQRPPGARYRRHQGGGSGGRRGTPRKRRQGHNDRPFDP